jgi:hypothetical protein
VAGPSLYTSLYTSHTILAGTPQGVKEARPCFEGAPFLLRFRT